MGVVHKFHHPNGRDYFFQSWLRPFGLGGVSPIGVSPNGGSPNAGSRNGGSPNNPSVQMGVVQMELVGHGRLSTQLWLLTQPLFSIGK